MPDDSLFNTLRFHWNRTHVPADLPVHSLERARCRLQRMLPEFVWDAAAEVLKTFRVG